MLMTLHSQCTGLDILTPVAESVSTLKGKHTAPPNTHPTNPATHSHRASSSTKLYCMGVGALPGGGRGCSLGLPPLTSSSYFTLVLYTYTHTRTCAHTTYAYMCIHETCMHVYVYIHMHIHTQYLTCKMFKAKIPSLNSVWQLLPWNMTWKTCSLLFGGSGSRPALAQLFVVIW